MVRTLVLFILVLASGCASTRAPIPVGEIPSPRSVTSDEEQYGHEILGELSKEYKLDFNDPNLARVQEIVDRLTKAAKADKEPWHVYLFDAPEVKNAAATRGNHVFVWSGIFKSVTTDDELSVILAHELGHVLANHTDPDPHEQAKKILIQVGAIAAGIAVTAATRNVYISNNLGRLASAVTEQVGSGVAINPFAKDLEFEADHIGLMLMAEAKYNPEAAISFWQNVGHDPDFSNKFSFFSTHPSSEDRLAKIREAMPLALQRYRGEASASSPNTFGQMNSGDTFDVRGQVAGGAADALQPRDPQLPPAPSVVRNGAEMWKVVTPRAFLRETADDNAKIIGEFRGGATVPIIGHQRGWLEVEGPDRGFIRGSTAVPIFDKNGIKVIER